VSRLRTRGQVFYYPAHEWQSERFGCMGGRVRAIDFVTTDLELPRVSVEVRGVVALRARRLSARALPELDVHETAMSLVAVFARLSTTDRRCAATAREYLHAHFAGRVTLREIAEAAGVHPVHLSRAFPERFGITLGDYLRSLRLDYAARELTATDRAIADIALDAGFASQSHLTRQFTAAMAISPAAYRRVIRQGGVRPHCAG
jgi:AraC family transcriptional regulator